MTLTDVKQNIDIAASISERVANDIDEIVESNRQELLHDLPENLSEAKTTAILAERIFNLFLYTRLYLYDQTDTSRYGIIQSIKYDYAPLFRTMENGYQFQDELISKIQSYFDSFDIVNFTNDNNKYINDILALGKNNTYAQQLYNICLYAFYNNLDALSTRLLINSLAADYYFRVVMPTEDESIAKERYRIENDIPDFSDVYLGQEWVGRNRMADFIRSLKLTPKPAGKNSRVAQEKSILRSCAFTDDKPNQILTLLELYPERRPKYRKERTKKYEHLVTVLLLNTLLKTDDGTLRTTKDDFLIRIGAIPNSYKRVPVDFYREVIPDRLLQSGIDLSGDLQTFRNITKERFKHIICPILESLNDRSIIKYRSYPVVVTLDSSNKKVYTSIFDSESLGLKKGELAKMMMQAEQFAASQIEVTVFDEQLRQTRKVQLKNIGEVMKHWKLPEYREHYDKFIREEYGWLYTFEEIEIVLTDNKKYVQETLADASESCKSLNKLITDALHTTVRKKYAHKEAIYQSRFEDVERKYTGNADVKELYDCGILDKDDIGRQVNAFRYSTGFPERTEYFIRHELELNKSAQQQFQHWKQIHQPSN